MSYMYMHEKCLRLSFKFQLSVISTASFSSRYGKTKRNHHNDSTFVSLCINSFWPGMSINRTFKHRCTRNNTPTKNGCNGDDTEIVMIWIYRSILCKKIQNINLHVEIDLNLQRNNRSGNFVLQKYVSHLFATPIFSRFGDKGAFAHYFNTFLLRK